MTDTNLNTEKIIVTPEIKKSEIIISYPELQEQKKQILKKIQKSIELPGFRKGKTPMSIIERKYSTDAFYDAFEDLLEKKTKDVLLSNPPMYFIYKFDKTNKLNDDGKDIIVEIEYFMQPPVDSSWLKDKKLSLVKYEINDHQREVLIYSLLMVNFLSLLDTHTVNLQNDLYEISFQLVSKDDEKRAITLPIINTYQIKSLGIHQMLPNEVTEGNEYSIDIKKWKEILQNIPSDSSLRDNKIFKFVQDSKDDENIVIEIKTLFSYVIDDKYLNKEAVKDKFNLSEEIDNITIDLVKDKLNQTVDAIVKHIENKDNTHRIVSFKDNLLDVEVPEYFVKELYDSRMSNKDKETLPLGLFNVILKKNIKENILKRTLKNIYSTPNENEIIENATQYYYITEIITGFYMLPNIDIDNLKKRIADILRTNNDEHTLDAIYEAHATYALPQLIGRDIAVEYETKNINESSISSYIHISKEIFS